MRLLVQRLGRQSTPRFATVSGSMSSQKRSTNEAFGPCCLDLLFIFHFSFLNLSRDMSILKYNIYYICVCVCVQLLQSCPTLCNPLDCSLLLCPWESPDKNTGAGCCALLQGIFLNQPSKPDFLYVSCIGRQAVLFFNH